MADEHPTPFQKKTIWVAKTFFAITVIGALSVGLIWLIGYILGFLQPVDAVTRDVRHPFRHVTLRAARLAPASVLHEDG